MISSHGTEYPHGTEHAPRYCTHIIQGEYAAADIQCELKKTLDMKTSFSPFPLMMGSVKLFHGKLWNYQPRQAQSGKIKQF